MLLHRDIMVQRFCPEASPGPSLLLLLSQAGQRRQALGKSALHIHPWCSTRGELRVLAFLARLQLCTSGPDICFAG